MLSKKQNYPERNKVLEGLKVCSGNCDEKKCPYSEYGDECLEILIKDCYELFKEKE